MPKKAPAREESQADMDAMDLAVRERSVVRLTEELYESRARLSEALSVVGSRRSHCKALQRRLEEAVWHLSSLRRRLADPGANGKGGWGVIDAPRECYVLYVLWEGDDLPTVTVSFSHGSLADEVRRYTGELSRVVWAGPYVLLTPEAKQVCDALRQCTVEVFPTPPADLDGPASPP